MGQGHDVINFDSPCNCFIGISMFFYPSEQSLEITMFTTISTNNKSVSVFIFHDYDWYCHVKLCVGGD